MAPETVGSPVDAQMSPEELLERLRRERADFLNYKRRIERERAADVERARAEVVQRLLPVLDDLERALSQRPIDLERHPWGQGVGVIHRTLVDALRDLGVQRIGEEGEPFDPERHDALFYHQQADATDQLVANVIRAGYQLHDTLLRPAQVAVVGTADAGTETNPETPSPVTEFDERDEGNERDERTGR